LKSSGLGALLTLVALLAATSLGLLAFRDVRLIGETGLAGELPAKIGPRTGRTPLYCRSEECGNVVSDEPGAPAEACPVCGSGLDPMSPAERRLLPADTTVLRRQYTAPGHDPMLVSVVFMGADRTSIHRPQMCLEFQGHRIVEERVIAVPLGGDPPLKAMHLGLVHVVQAPDGTERTAEFTYTYWFAGGGTTTPFFMRMQMAMAAERVLKSTAHRWAYVSILAPRASAGRDSAEVARFIGRLWPLLSAPAP